MKKASKIIVDNSSKNIAKQPNEFTHSIFKGTAMAYRLVLFAIFKISKNSDNLSLKNKQCHFSQSEFCEHLGMPTGSNTSKVIEKATDELTQCFITLKNTNPKNDNDSYFSKITWFQKVELLKNGDITLTFNDELSKYFEFKVGYTALELLEIGNLRSFYAMRFYGLAKSKSGYRGTKGNNAEEWWFSYTEEELRNLFEISDSKYLDRRKFVEKVIKQPCEEICAKTNLIILLTAEKLGKGKYLWKFNCSLKKQDVLQIKDTDHIKTEKRIVNAEIEQLEAYKTKYPKQFEKALYLVKTNNQLPFSFQMNEEFDALKLLIDMGLKV